MKTLFRKWYLELLVLYKRHRAQRYYEKYTGALGEFEYYKHELQLAQEKFVYVDFD